MESSVVFVDVNLSSKRAPAELLDCCHFYCKTTVIRAGLFWA
jgi:hypothetical protein